MQALEKHPAAAQDRGEGWGAGAAQPETKNTAHEGVRPTYHRLGRERAQPTATAGQSPRASLAFQKDTRASALRHAPPMPIQPHQDLSPHNIICSADLASSGGWAQRLRKMDGAREGGEKEGGLYTEVYPAIGGEFLWKDQLDCNTGSRLPQFFSNINCCC